MTAINLSGLAANSTSPKYDSAYPSGNRSGGGGSNLSVSGTVAHNSVITITDALNRFGTRTNVKPLYVAMGTQKAGLSLGRKTGDYFHSSQAQSSAHSVGSIANAYRFDFKASSADAWGQDSFLLEDTTRPFLQYVERYYDFDILQTIYQASGGVGFNLKTNRIWATVGQNNDIYVGYQGLSALSQRIYCEWLTGTPPADYTDEECPGFQWLSEEFVFRNSSDVDVADAYYDVYRDNRLLNDLGHVFTTRTTARPTALNNIFLDQVSNGCGSGVSNVFAYYGYMCFDDEWRRAYLGNNATRASCTKLIPMPQTAWAAGSISINLVNSLLSLSGNYLHIRTAENTWLESVQI
jgi:hypothetical protein